MTDNINKLLKKDFSYPNINDDEFQKKIYEKREFYYHKIPKQPKLDNYPDLKNYREQVCSSNFNLQSHQSLLSNFINYLPIIHIVLNKFFFSSLPLVS